MTSRWTERQREMLGAMGVRVFEAPQPPDPDPVRPEPAERLRPDQPERNRHEGVVAVESSRDIATLDWPALRTAVSQCRACGLCESRTQTVFGVGHESARLMIIGEAPGENEDLQGEPFVGQAGKLLDNMLASIGLTRAGEIGRAHV